MSRYTLTLGELRRLTSQLPDDTEIFVDDGSLQFFEVRLKSYGSPRGALPPVLEHPHALLLELGQVWNEERDLDHRVDAALGNY